eukprot:TRINITY_DN5405_c0_g1_i4.p1 TRINITY_DN5405_c0_g1~~TRINITY_DN5405_c0_g1_i4.p1  ORF type:complete len:163 (+),score=50.15 TRINITY_DN5405_c0_g1_i4:35-490(+)
MASAMKAMKAVMKSSMKATKKPAMKKVIMKAAMKKVMMKASMKAAVMKKATKVMKVMKVSAVAKGKRMRLAVFSGKKEKTYTGLKKTDFKKNRTGKIVSRKRSEAGKKSYARIKGWTVAVQKAKKDLGITGFVAVKKGTPLYKAAKAIYGA